MDPLSAADGELRVLLADDSLVAVDKPAGLLSVPGRGIDKLDCAATRVQQQIPDALVVHRLDMATSGLLLFARGSAMQRHMSLAFAGREVAKRYVAIVTGVMTADEGTVDLPLAADWPNRPIQKVDRAAGKPSVTHWRVLARDGHANTTRVELEPVTGRSHQLRVHMMAIGHPIVGDALYADAQVPARSPRLLLHAAALGFAHPATGAAVQLRSDPAF